MLAESGSVMVRQTLERKAAQLKESKKFRTWREHHKQFWSAKGYVRVSHLHLVARTIQE